MTHLQFRDRLADVMNAYHMSNQSHLANTIREMIREFDAGLTDSSLHPDTARADAAERMLREAIKLANSYAPGELVAMCLIRDVPGLREWYDARNERHSQSLKRNGLIAKRNAAFAEAARLDAELSAMGGLES